MPSPMAMRRKPRIMETPTNLRRVTVHDPQTNLPPKMRCIQLKPYCNMRHYHSVPAIDTVGTFTISEIVGYDTAVEMAVYAQWLGKGSVKS